MNTEEKRFISIRFKDENDEVEEVLKFDDLDKSFNLILDYNSDDFKKNKNNTLIILVNGEFKNLSISVKNNESSSIFLELQEIYSNPSIIKNLILDDINKLKILGGIIEIILIGNINKINIANIYFSKVQTMLTNKVNVLKLNSCSINELILNANGSRQTAGNLSTKNIHIENSDINNIMINHSVNEIEIEKSKINEFKILKAHIGLYKNTETKINQISGVSVDTFLNHSEDSSNLGIMYSKENEDYELYEFYNCKKMDVALKNSSVKNKIPLWFLKHSIGYGFKPSRAFFFSLFCIFSFAILYLLNDLIKGNIIIFLPKNINDILNSIELFFVYVYQSGITYTTIGFEDMIKVNPFIGLFYVIEAMLGVSVLSLMVVALTRKYFFGKY